MTSNSSVPTFDDRQKMWASLDFPAIEHPFPAITRFVEELRPLYANGKVLHRVFRMPPHPTLDWFLTRNQFHESGFFEKLWTLPSVKAAIPFATSELNFYDTKIFSFCSPFLLGGSLAGTLSAGGAYRQFARSGIEAKRIGEDAALEMLGGTFDHSLAYECGIAWSDFFQDVAWDHTYIAVEQSSRVVHVLLATDTD